LLGKYFKCIPGKKANNCRQMKWGLMSPFEVLSRETYQSCINKSVMTLLECYPRCYSTMEPQIRNREVEIILASLFLYSKVNLGERLILYPTSEQLTHTLLIQKVQSLISFLS
jgi:hypothetical protein